MELDQRFGLANDDPGIVAVALQRVDSLYRLARYYREHDQPAVGATYATAGVNFPLPKTHPLWFAMRQEFAICGFYAEHPGQRLAAAKVCDELSLDREAPSPIRELARFNNRFYQTSFAAIFPNAQIMPVRFRAPEHFHAGNCSISGHGDRLIMIQRCVNYIIETNGSYHIHDADGAIRTRNFFIELADDLATLSAREVLPPADLPQPAYDLVRGFEDARPFYYRNGWWCSSTLRELTPEGWCEQALARIDEQAGQCRLVDWRVMRPVGPKRHEKNWMPRVKDDCLTFLYRSDPTCWVADDGSMVQHGVARYAVEDFRGSSQFIAFGEGWLAVVHQVQIVDGVRQYLHRFVWHDDGGTLRHVSRQFYMLAAGINYIAGLAWHRQTERLLLSFSVNDGAAYIASVAADDVAKNLSGFGLC
jgi:hypothetical protein